MALNSYSRLIKAEKIFSSFSTPKRKLKTSTDAKAQVEEAISSGGNMSTRSLRIHSFTGAAS